MQRKATRLVLEWENMMFKSARGLTNSNGHSSLTSIKSSGKRRYLSVFMEQSEIRPMCQNNLVCDVNM